MTLDLFTPPESDPQEWTQVYLSRTGRTYRYRIRTDRVRDMAALIWEFQGDRAPGHWRFELEYSDRDGTWREVRNHNTRLEIWALIRERL